MRVGVPILRGTCGEVSGGRSGGDWGEAELHPVPTAGAGAGGDAVEFSVLAGVAICSAGTDGGERGAAETCVDRAAERAADRGNIPTGWIPGRSVSDFADWFEGSGQDSGRSAGDGGNAYGQ